VIPLTLLAYRKVPGPNSGNKSILVPNRYSDLKSVPCGSWWHDWANFFFRNRCSALRSYTSDSGACLVSTSSTPRPQFLKTRLLFEAFKLKHSSNMFPGIGKCELAPTWFNWEVLGLESDNTKWLKVIKELVCNVNERVYPGEYPFIIENNIHRRLRRITVSLPSIHQFEGMQPKRRTNKEAVERNAM
jgi:hypothetical protein